MAFAVTIQIDFKDAKNKSSNTRIRVPTGFSIAQYTEFAQDVVQLVANISTARIVGASVNFALDLSTAVLTNTVSALADVATKAFIKVNSAVAGFFGKFEIPTFDEDNLVVVGTDQIDTADTNVAAFITGLEEGYDLTTGGVMAPVDKYGNDLTTTTIARELFQKRAA
jgi:hypothetical protein